MSIKCTGHVFTVTKGLTSRIPVTSYVTSLLPHCGVPGNYH